MAQLKWIQRTFSCIRTAHHLHCQKHYQLPAEQKVTFIEPGVAGKQSRLEPGRLCSVGSPEVASVLRWLFETVEHLKQAIVDEWYALSQKFIDHSINKWWRRLKCVVQQNGRHIEHLLNNLWVVGYTRSTFLLLLQFMHICELYSFIDIFTSSTFTCMLFCLAPPAVVQLNRVKVTWYYFS